MFAGLAFAGAFDFGGVHRAALVLISVLLRADAITALQQYAE